MTEITENWDLTNWVNEKRRPDQMGADDNNDVDVVKRLTYIFFAVFPSIHCAIWNTFWHFFLSINLSDIGLVVIIRFVRSHRYDTFYSCPFDGILDSIIFFRILTMASRALNFILNWEET